MSSIVHLSASGEKKTALKNKKKTSMKKLLASGGNLPPQFSAAQRRRNWISAAQRRKIGFEIKGNCGSGGMPQRCKNGAKLPLWTKWIPLLLMKHERH